MVRVSSKRLYKAISCFKIKKLFCAHNFLFSLWFVDLGWFLYFVQWLFFLANPFPRCFGNFFIHGSTGSLGYDAIYQGHWSAAPWPHYWFSMGYMKNIVLLELFPILVSLELWGIHLHNSRLLFHYDIKRVAYAINWLSSKSLPVLAVLQHFFKMFRT